VSFAGEEKVGIHAGFQLDGSGQLRFLGSIFMSASPVNDVIFHCRQRTWQLILFASRHVELHC
jgi:hypothetical protein